jgi:DNA-binding LacI/PurR family transcriptional regulator
MIFQTAAQFIPPITTFRQPVKEMVRCAFQAIIEHAASQTIYLPGKLIVRKTT